MNRQGYLPFHIPHNQTLWGEFRRRRAADFYLHPLKNTDVDLSGYPGGLCYCGMGG